jgi:hypothetical protein
VQNSVSEQIQNLQNCQTAPNKTLERRGPQTDKHLPRIPFTGMIFRFCFGACIVNFSLLCAAEKRTFSYGTMLLQVEKGCKKTSVLLVFDFYVLLVIFIESVPYW